MLTLRAMWHWLRCGSSMTLRRWLEPGGRYTSAACSCGWRINSYEEHE